MKYRLRMLFIHPVLLFIMFGVFYVLYYCDRRHKISRQNLANNKREYLRVPLSIHVYYACVCVRGALCRRRSSSSGGGVSCSVRWPVRDSHIMT